MNNSKTKWDFEKYKKSVRLWPKPNFPWKTSTDGRTIIPFNLINRAFGDLSALITGTHLTNLNMALVFLKTEETVDKICNVNQDVFYVFTGGVLPSTQSRMLIPRDTVTFDIFKLVIGLLEEHNISYFHVSKLHDEAATDHC
jgi:hypothetical protein